MNAIPLRSAIACSLLLACATAAWSQPLTFTTMAGNPGHGHTDGVGNSARFSGPRGVAADAAGNVYVADTENHTIRKITPGGTVTTLAGLPGASGSADGVGLAARFSEPRGVAVDGAGTVYVADMGNHTIRQITPAGLVSTVAGSAGLTGSADGTGSDARFYHPEGVAADSAGSVYVADTWNHTIRKIAPGGVVSTLAGLAGSYGSTDGTGSGARFYQPQGITVDSGGQVYVGDTGNQTIRKITAGGVVSTLAGLPGNYGSADGSGASARFYGPAGLAADGAGNVYVADYLNQTVRKLTPAGVVSTLAGLAGSYGSADGTNSGARFWGPVAVAAVGTNNATLYVADADNGTIRQITATGVVTTLAGSASTGSTDGTGSAARFYWPGGAAVDIAGNVYVADTQNSTIRKVTPDGTVNTLAGSPGNHGSADGTGASARFYGPQGLAVDTMGDLYVADTLNSTVRKITPGGVVSTLAGTPGIKGSANDTGSAAQFDGPLGVAVDNGGNVYVTDTWNHTIRKITPAGAVSTLAGYPGRYGDIDGTGSNVGTNSARFNCPVGVAVDTAGNVYVTDSRNHTVRRVTTTGVVSTLAGSPGLWGSADGTNTEARFCLPSAIAVDAATNVYVLDSGNHTVRKLSPAGTNWVVTTVAGMAGASGSSDGVGTAARFNHPAGLAADGSGTLYVADTGNNTLRKGQWITSGPPVIAGQPQSQTVSQGASTSFSVIAGGAAPLYYQWRLYGTNISGATAANYTRVNVQPGDAGPYSVVVSNGLGTELSSDALLTVVVPPGITTHPLSQAVAQGADAVFSVEVSGTAPFSFQWFFNGAAIPGANAGSYTRANAQPADSGSYSVVVANLAGTVTSSNAVLLVVALPEITMQPYNRVLNPGGLASFMVAAGGTPPLSYQWRWNGTDLAGATETSLLLNNVTTNQNGLYAVAVTNAYGAVTSELARLTVMPAFQPGGLVSIWKLAPGTRPYLTVSSLPYQRGMAYNPANGHLLVLSRSAPSVHVLDAATGVDLHQLSVSGISGGTYALLMIGVADDGAVYAGNLTTASSTTPFTLYRWANDSAGLAPTVADAG